MQKVTRGRENGEPQSLVPVLLGATLRQQGDSSCGLSAGSEGVTGFLLCGRQTAVYFILFE